MGMVAVDRTNTYFGLRNLSSGVISVMGLSSTLHTNALILLEPWCADGIRT